MSKPVVVTIPHTLGKQEAVRRLQAGLPAAGASFGHLFQVEAENWTADRLDFRVIALGQAVNGAIDVDEDYVRLEVSLPWLLARLAEAVQPLIRREGAALLEKK